MKKKKGRTMPLILAGWDSVEKKFRSRSALWKRQQMSKGEELL